MAKKKIPPRNPKGINQFAGTKSRNSFSFRLDAKLDEKVREYCAAHNITQTQFWEQLAEDFFSIE
ncbi:hypothetical protein E1H12_18965 [Geitlerinema sp. P-1104]|uniref:hypothetical protein n=1 Tax=Geitlerinema sp. P-1104 TaxID=2546230 RepID=UPI001476D428|nr:hypothetical protein [Geitlerinema sp. P-1104]NMG60539.1 hypothetical protein [Geitlerinema sp. P-1104]